jgi:hypothetical protein
MADIISSSKQSGDVLMENFVEVVALVNEQFKDLLLSPLTITLGDEFQGVAVNLEAGVKVMVELEEAIIQKNKLFTLRYIMNYGQIDTPINAEIAYGMLGEGLTQARELLEQVKQKKHDRFLVLSGNEQLNEMLNRALLLYQSIVDDWKPTDSLLISTFLQHLDYKLVAEQLGKVRSLMWKREKSLKIKEYIAARELLHLIASSQ